jgi:hypothetical protein
MIVPQKTLQAHILDALPWLSARQDGQRVAKLLDAAGLERATPLGSEVDAMLRLRISECRDFYALRGVRPRQSTVLQMAGRSLAADREQIARLDALTEGRGALVLHALSRQIEAWATGKDASSLQPISRMLDPLAGQLPALGVGQKGDRRASQHQGHDEAAEPANPGAHDAMGRIADTAPEQGRQDQSQHRRRAHQRLQDSPRLQQRANPGRVAPPPAHSVPKGEIAELV